MQVAVTVNWIGDEPDEVFAGGPAISDVRAFNRGASLAAAKHIARVVELRWFAAMTGAMRWEGSQEARINAGYGSDYA